MGLYQIKKLLYSRDHQQKEKATYRMGEDTTHHIADKGAIPKMYKNLIQIHNNNNRKQPD